MLPGARVVRYGIPTVTLTVADASNAHAAENVVLGTAITLVVQEGAHGHTAEAPA